MKSSELRKIYLDFFKSKGHTIVKSSPIIPQNDPTLLFTTAGMVQFKPYYSRAIEPPFPCAATIQKCLRAGGKGSDLENVGKTPRHHTFFEMLGNFSFGDYFKKEAIEFAFEFITKVVKIPLEKLWVSVYQDDDEAAKLWQEIAGISKDRIVYLGKKDNWWGPAGDEGACGPCSEIYIDLRDKIEYPPCEDETPGPCDGFLEFWNIVFNQYYQDKEGKLHPLEHTGIDTGMGFERLCMILQNKASVYETDIFVPIIAKICELSNLKYEGKNKVPINVIADHTRAVTFVLSEGIFPSNEGRGYVLRHILRRAIRYGKFIGFDSPFLYQVVDAVVESMGDAYPEITEKVEMVKSVIFSEEEAFFKTLNRGLERLNELIAEAKQSKTNTLSGDAVFMLYDSLGFPLDFTEQVASDEELTIDMKRFHELMAEQKTRARANWKGDATDYKVISGKVKPTVYIGDSEFEGESKIAMLLKGGQIAESATESEDCIVITEKTPFYGEKGGQVGDIGIIEKDGGKIVISETRIFEDIILHIGRILNGSFKKGDKVKLLVDKDRKAAIARNHTATHLIHKALKEAIGEHAAQAGSLVGPDRLRFDFTHTKSLTKDEIEKIENSVNKAVLKNLPVHKTQMTKDEAVKSGAVAIFEEKYGDVVRVIEVEGFSKELCGGTHVNRSGDIGLVKIVEESSISAGTRRLEAVTGLNSLDYYRSDFTTLKQIASSLNTTDDKILERLEHLLETQRQKDKEIDELKKQLAKSGLDDLMKNAKSIGDAKIIAQKVEMDADSMMTAMDEFKEKVQSGVIFMIASPASDKVTIVVGVTKNLTAKIKAGDIAKATAAIVGGGGGGRPDMAQAGGKNPAKMDEALAKAIAMIDEALK